MTRRHYNTDFLKTSYFNRFEDALAALVTTGLNQYAYQYLDPQGDQPSIQSQKIMSGEENIIANVYERDFRKHNDETTGPGLYLRFREMNEEQQVEKLTGIHLVGSEFIKKDSIHLKLAEYKFDSRFYIVPTITYEQLSANATLAKQKRQYSFNTAKEGFRREDRIESQFYYPTLKQALVELMVSEYSHIDPEIAKSNLRPTFFKAAWVADNDDSPFASIVSSHVHAGKGQWPRDGIFLQLSPAAEEQAIKQMPELVTLQRYQNNETSLFLAASYDKENILIPEPAFQQVRQQIIDGRVSDYTDKIRVERHYRMEPGVRNVEKKGYETLAEAVTAISQVQKKEFKSDLEKIVVFKGNDQEELIIRELIKDERGKKEGVYNRVPLSKITPQIISVMASHTANMTNISDDSFYINFRDKNDLQISRRHKPRTLAAPDPPGKSIPR